MSKLLRDNRYFLIPYLITLIICAVFIFISSCHTDSNIRINWNPDMANSLEELKEGFKNPPIDFSTAPFWVWNDEVTEEKIDFQLKEFKFTPPPWKILF